MGSASLDLYRRAAQLIWPGDCDESALCPPLGGAEIEVLLDVLQRNKVPLLSLNPRAAGPFLSEVEVTIAVEADRALWQRLRGEYAGVHDTLEEAGVQGVFIKSAGLAPSFPYMSDNLDLLVPRDQGPRARDLLRRIGYVELSNLDERGAKLLLRRFHLGKEVCSVHLHMHVGWWVSFVDEQQLISRAGPSLDDGMVWIPSPEDSALVNMAHSLYENKGISLSDVQKIERCWLLRGGDAARQQWSGSANVDWDYMQGVAIRKGWLEGLCICLLLYDDLENRLHGRSLVSSQLREEALPKLTRWQRDYLQSLCARPLSLPFPIAFGFSKRLFYEKICRDRTTSKVRKLRDAVGHTARGTHLKLGIRSQTSMLVAITGVDGSGKTTQAAMLRAAFRSCAIRARCVWSRASSSSFMDLFIRWGKRLMRQGDAPVGTPNGQGVLHARQAMLSSQLARWGWQWLVVFDLLVRYWLQVGWPLLRGEVVIADRYVDDGLADLAVHLGWKSPERALAGRLLRLLSPHPHMTYVLNLPASVAAARMAGQRESPEHLEQLGAAYLRLTERSGAVEVDAQQPLGDMADLIVHRTLARYFERYGTWVNALFAANPVRPSLERDEHVG